MLPNTAERSWVVMRTGRDIELFGGVAKGLARNPLGIIALFIVLVYGLAALVTMLGGTFTHDERLPLIYFLVAFPVMVLGVFGWLVSAHSGKLFAPSDFKNEENYVRMQLAAVASLTKAAAKNESESNGTDLEGIVEAVQQLSSSAASEKTDGWRKRVLWVDDRPENNTYERQAFEAMGFTFSLSLSTADGLAALEAMKFAAVISDMGRREGPREGYVLLDEMRKRGISTPVFIYASSNSPEHKRETQQHGGQGCTNSPQELFEMVTGAVLEKKEQRHQNPSPRRRAS